MQLVIEKTEKLQGEITIPASKSHTIRAVIIASLAEGRSTLVNPLYSEDTKAAINACQALGAKIEQSGTRLTIEGFGANPRQPTEVLDMLNSGTSTNLLLGILAALGLTATITGDASLRKRPVNALTEVLRELGLTIEFHATPGCPPLSISGKMKGSTITVDAAKSSQYVSSLLLACPMLGQDTEIFVRNPTELPYVAMTVQWLDEQAIKYEREGFTYFKIFGNQTYRPFEKKIPADWSSATFPICAAAITESNVFIKGLDIDDVQGDKAVIHYLKDMGADIAISKNGISIKGRDLKARELDINATPDALPALSVIGCYAHGETKLYNVAQARVKETDRIRVMAEELKKMNAFIQELPDGLLIRHSNLKGAHVQGHHDHRVVMALSIAAFIAEGRTTIDTAEAVSVTYPDYVTAMNALGTNIRLQKEDEKNVR